MGNAIPKTKMNKLTGIRYTGEIQDEKTWNLRQRIGGISMIIAGIIIIILNLIFKTNSTVILITLILLISVIPISVLMDKIAIKK